MFRLARPLRFALCFACAALVASGCNREKDPYRDWKAPALLEEGERLLRAGDLEAAEKVLRRGATRAEKDGARAAQTHTFYSRLLFIAAARDNLPDALKLYDRMNAGGSVATLDPYATAELAVMLERAGKPAEARAMGEKLAARLAARRPEPEELPIYLAGWIIVDRARTENVEINHAKEASDAFVALMNTLAETLIPPRQPLPPGVRTWVTRYVDHLYDSDRSVVAKEVAELVVRIDEVAATDDDKRSCIPLDAALPTLGCLADWPSRS